jgi:undecaprenyl diphosphate synthase
MTLLQEYLIVERSEIMEQNIRFTTIGRRHGLTPEVIREIDENIRLSANNTGMTLCLAINYSGRADLADAVKSIGQQVKAGKLDPDNIDETTIGDNLSTAGMPEPDLLIRTAGEMRVSNFLLWEISYAEIWVTSKCWPDFDEATLREALRDFTKRERRFGGLNSGQ